MSETVEIGHLLFSLFPTGSVIVFVALLSTSFVGRVIERHHIYGILLIVLGLVVVGASDLSGNSGDKNSIITGRND